MAKISLVARIVAIKGREADLEKAIAAAISAAEEEPGLEVYSAHAVTGQPGEYYFFEVYRGPEDRPAHGKGPRMAQVVPGLIALLAQQPEVVMMTPLAAKGIDL